MADLCHVIHRYCYVVVLLTFITLWSQGVKLATLSCDPVESHKKWLEDVVSHCENNSASASQAPDSIPCMLHPVLLASACLTTPWRRR